MTNEQSPRADNGGRDRFDLEERTALFGEAIISFAKRVVQNIITRPLISQLVRCGTSIGANYCEADEADTNKEFRYRIDVCKRESRETCFQIRVIVAAEPQLNGGALGVERREGTHPYLRGHPSAQRQLNHSMDWSLILGH